MFPTVMKAAILMSVLILTVGTLYAQIGNPEISGIALKTEPSLEPVQKNPYLVDAISRERQKIYVAFINNKKYSAIDEDKDKKVLRLKWEELLGIDIFYPYFKIHEIEDWIGEKASVKVFNIKGKPKFENNQVKYIFKVKF